MSDHEKMGFGRRLAIAASVGTMLTGLLFGAQEKFPIVTSAMQEIEAGLPDKNTLLIQDAVFGIAAGLLVFKVLGPEEDDESGGGRKDGGGGSKVPRMPVNGPRLPSGPDGVAAVPVIDEHHYKLTA